jgi:hypothetical protein
MISKLSGIAKCTFESGRLHSLYPAQGRKLLTREAPPQPWVLITLGCFFRLVPYGPIVFFKNCTVRGQAFSVALMFAPSLPSWALRKPCPAPS